MDIEPVAAEEEFPVLFKSDEDGVIFKHSELLYKGKHPELKRPVYMPSQAARKNR